MRAIKYRIWEGDKTDGYFVESTYEWWIHAEGTVYKDGNPTESGFVIEQFTGLFDKKGDEIYEGDILRLSCGYVSGGTDHSVIAVVEYDEDRFRTCLLDKKMKVVGGSHDGYTLSQYEVHSWVGSHTCLREWPEKLEVIGNIHENPELLK